MRGVWRRLDGLPGFFFIEPLQYLEFVCLMEKSTVAVADSGGIQEEAPGLGKPVLVMRNTTERPEALDAGSVKWVGTDHDLIVSEVSRLPDDKDYYDKMSHAVNPYGDGKACSRFVRALKGGERCTLREVIIDNYTLDELSARAKANPRLRQHMDLRNSPEDLSQRMLNAIEPGTVMPIHRHLTTSETVICVRGHFEEYFYDGNGVLVETIDMRPGGVLLNVPAGQWHSLKSLESGTVLFEAKDGPYAPLGEGEIMVGRGA